MGFRTVKMQPATYSSNSMFPIKVPQLGNLCELYLNLTGAPTLTAANNTRATTGRGDEWSILNKLELVANGQEVIQTFTGPQLLETARRDYGIHPRNTPTLGDVFTANPSFNSVLPVPIWTPQAKRTIDTALQANRLQSLQLNVNWGTHTDVNSNATAFTTSPILNVWGLYNIDDFIPRYLKKVFRTSLTLTGSATNARVDLPTGPAYHRLLVNVTSSGSDDSAKISNVQVKSGSTVFYDGNDVVTREIGRFHSETPRDNAGYTIPVYTTMGTANGTLEDETASYSESATENNFAEVMKAVEQFARVHRSSKSDALAWYDINFAPDGQMEQSIQTVIGGRALSEFYLEFNASGACTIDVYSQAIVANPFGVPAE